MSAIAWVLEDSDGWRGSDPDGQRFYVAKMKRTVWHVWERLTDGRWGFRPECFNNAEEGKAWAETHYDTRGTKK